MPIFTILSVRNWFLNHWFHSILFLAFKEFGCWKLIWFSQISYIFFHTLQSLIPLGAIFICLLVYFSAISILLFSIWIKKKNLLCLCVFKATVPLRSNLIILFFFVFKCCSSLSLLFLFSGVCFLVLLHQFWYCFVGISCWELRLHCTAYCLH